MMGDVQDHPMRAWHRKEALQLQEAAAERERFAAQLLAADDERRREAYYAGYRAGLEDARHRGPIITWSRPRYELLELALFLLVGTVVGFGAVYALFAWL